MLGFKYARTFPYPPGLALQTYFNSRCEPAREPPINGLLCFLPPLLRFSFVCFPGFFFKCVEPLYHLQPSLLEVYPAVSVS